MWNMDKGVHTTVIDRPTGDGLTIAVHRYVAFLLDGTEVDLAPFGNLMPTPDQFMNWAWDVSGLPGKVFQRNMTEPDTESRFDPAKVFKIDRALVAQDIIAGEVFSFCGSFWMEPRPVMAVQVTPTTVTVMEERRGPDKPQRRRGVRMLQLEDGT